METQEQILRSMLLLQPEEQHQAEELVVATLIILVLQTIQDLMLVAAVEAVKTHPLEVQTAEMVINLLLLAFQLITVAVVAVVALALVV
jgi:hypothetical protein